MKHYVIIGNGIASAACMEGIRSADPCGSVTVISEERHPVYCRPLISYYLQGKTTLEKMLYRDPDFYERMDANVLYGRKALLIDPENKLVQLDQDESIPYDMLCIASGSSPFVPPFEGLDKVKKKHSFMTLDDALAIDRDISSETRVLIVGAGLIGLKCAEGLYGRVKSLTVCDLAPRILSSILDEECAALMQRHLEEKGISFLLSDTAVRFEENEAEMKSGVCVPFDLLILAVGVRANSGAAKDAGIDVNRGILVNEFMESSLPGIYAAGDCAEGMDISEGRKKVLAILPNAYFQGFTAGVNMAGGKKTFDQGIPMNSIGFFGLHAMTAGSCVGELYEEKTANSIRRLFTKDGLLKGYILIGCEDRAGIYTAMIREKTPLSSVNFEMLKKAAGGVCRPDRGIFSPGP